MKTLGAATGKTPDIKATQRGRVVVTRASMAPLVGREGERDSGTKSARAQRYQAEMKAAQADDKKISLQGLVDTVSGAVSGNATDGISIDLPSIGGLDIPPLTFGGGRPAVPPADNAVATRPPWGWIGAGLALTAAMFYALFSRGGKKK